MADYIALIHKDAGSDYGVSFPDFPGCITAGKTIDEARELATEALAMHVAGMIEDGQEVPSPSPMAAVMKERANRDAVAFLVTLPERTERHVRIQVTMAEGLVAEIDARTDNRSKFLAAAARAALRPGKKIIAADQGLKRILRRAAKKAAKKPMVRRRAKKAAVVRQQ